MSSGHWIRHDGGPCPVKQTTLVDVLFRDGGERQRTAAGFYTTEWMHLGPDHDDIVGWRLSFPQRRTIWQRIASIFKRKDTQ